jgi:GNAT superfamily N-acetyltransferase
MREANERMQQAQWDAFWIPRDTRAIDRPELLYLTCERPLFYLNQVLRARAPEQRLPALIDEVIEAHAHTESSWSVYDGSDQDKLERLLQTAGYSSAGDSDGMVIEVSDFRARVHGGMRVEMVQDVEQLRDHLYVMESTFGDVTTHSDAELQELLAGCTGPTTRVVRFLARDAAAQPIAAGGMNLHPAQDLAYLWGGSTLPEARGQGAYHALLAARVSFAQERGIRTVGVYAMLDTSAPIIARCGFHRSGRLCKWRKLPSS